MVIKVFRHHWQLHFAILAVGDFLLGMGSFAAMNAMISASWATLPSLVCAVLFAAIAVICSGAMGLYTARQRSGFFGVVLRLLVAVGAGVFVSWLVAWLLLPSEQYRPMKQFLLSGCALLILTISFRFIMDRLTNEDWLKRKVLVYGAGKRAFSVAKLRRRSDRRGFVIVGFVEAEGDEALAELNAQLIPKEVSLLQYCQQHAIDEIVMAMDDRRRSFPMEALLDCRLDGIEVTELVSFLERETGKLHLDVLNPSWIIFSEGFRRGRIHAVLERGLDLLASILLTTVALPFMVLTAVAIKIEDGPRASIFYSQRRVGQYGRVFGVLKFRSMREDAEYDGKPQWATKNDSRVTRVGSVIRKTRIDELPQILNVVRGEMSFVGPRPERPEFVRELNERIPYYRERHNVKPGVTGWAQLCYPYGSTEEDALQKLQYDLYYVKNHSLLFYISVLIQTVEVIVWRKGAR